MVRILVLSLFLFTQIAGAAYLPQNAAVTVGGATITNLATNKWLRCNVDNTGGACSPRAPNTTAGYTAGAGGFKVRAIRTLVIVGTTVQIYLGYADTDSGMSGATGTNPIYAGTASTVQDQVVLAASTNWVETATDFVVPSGKFLFVKQTGGSSVSVQVIGYEL